MKLRTRILGFVFLLCLFTPVIPAVAGTKTLPTMEQQMVTTEPSWSPWCPWFPAMCWRR